MAIIVLDTDAASRLFERQLAPWAHHALGGNQLAITFVTIAEVVYGTRRRGWGASRVSTLEQYYQRTFAVLPTRSDHLVPIARTWARCVRTRSAVGSPFPSTTPGSRQAVSPSDTAC